MFRHLLQSLGLQQSEAAARAAWWPFQGPPPTGPSLERGFAGLSLLCWAYLVAAVGLLTGLALWGLRARRKRPRSPDPSTGEPMDHEEMMIPKGPPVLPAIKASGKIIEPLNMELPWIERDTVDWLNWHITQKKLEHHWCSPPHIQILSEFVIPPAPRKIPPELNQKLMSWVMDNTNGLPLLDNEQRKLLEASVKRKKKNQTRGLPSVIQTSWNKFWGLNGLSSHQIICSKMGKAGHSGLTNIDEKMRTLPLQHKTTGQNSKACTTKGPYKSTTIDQNSIDKLDMHRSKMNLEIKLHCLPELIQPFYQNLLSTLEKPLDKIIAHGEGNKPTRSLHIAFVKQDVADVFEMNQKKKEMARLLGLATPYEESMEMMIPEGPPVPPPIKSSGKIIEPLHMEIPWIESDIVDRLNCHVIRKKLEHHWGRPPHIQILSEFVISPTPRRIPPELNRKPISRVMDNTNGPPLLDKEQRKLLEASVKRQKKNQTRGLPSVIQTSWNNFWGLNGLSSHQIICSKMGKAGHSGLSNIDKEMRTLPLQHKTTGQNTKASTTKLPHMSTTIDQKSIDKLHMHISKMNLEIKLHCLPELIQPFYQNLLSTLEKPLDKIIAPGEGNKPTRSLRIAFVKQHVADVFEMNQKKKEMARLLGLATPYEESMEMMIPEGPPVPPPIKSSGKTIEPIHMEIPWIESDIVDRLNCHVTRKKVEHHWGRPPHIQILSEFVIPPAPRRIPPELNRKPISRVMDNTNGPPLLDKEQRKLLEASVKRQKKNQTRGLPSVIQTSWNNFWGLNGLTSHQIICSEMGKARYSGLSNIDEKMRTIPLQHKTTGQNSKACTTKGPYKSTTIDQNSIDKLDMHRSKMNLEIKLHCLPELIQPFYQNLLSTLEKPLDKIIAHGEGNKPTRSLHIAFVKQDVADVFEMNQKKKEMARLLGLATPYEESMEMMIPEGPPVPPPIKSSGKIIEPLHMEIPWIERDIVDRLNCHVIQKKLEHRWGRPPHIQIFSELVIPPAPRRIPPQLNRKSISWVMDNTNGPPLLDNEQRKFLEASVKRKKKNQTRGLPTVIQSSWNNFWGLNGLSSHQIICSKMGKAGHSGLSNIDKEMRTLPLQHKTTGQNTKASTTKLPHISTTIDQKSIDKLHMHISKMNLEIKRQFLPELIQPFYQNFLSTVEKPLDKIIAPGEGNKPTRSLRIAFVKQDVANVIEINQKHKEMARLLGLATPYEESMEMMIPEGPPVPPPIKSSGKIIEPIHMEIPWIESDIVDRLNCHVIQKKLEHHWGRPPHIQIFSELVITPAPRRIPPQLNQKPISWVMDNTNGPPLLDKEQRKLLEASVKRQKKNQTRGLPTVIQTSWNNFWGFNGLSSHQIICSEMGKARYSGLSNIDEEMRTLPLQHKTTGQNSKACTTKLPYKSTTIDQKSIDKLDMHISKMNLEIKLHCLPELIQPFYQNLLSTLEKPLDKIIAPGEGNKPTRSLRIAFFKQDVADVFEMNQKKKEMARLLGLATPYEESMEMMIPEGPPVPPPIKSSGKIIEPIHMEIPWIERDIVDRLNCHVIQKKLEHHWGRPPHIQIFSELVIPPAPRRIPPQLNRKPISWVMDNTNGPPLLENEQRKLLEASVKRKKKNQTQGLPTVIQTSWNNFWGFNGSSSYQIICSKMGKAGHSGLSNIDEEMRTLPLQHKTTGQNTKASTTKLPHMSTTID
ncbi:uncharacterized protein [Narcine bancroftii]|uniref:uncharacterized protein n=1 Tax=Narcine bancroftii TaxID=1343680 RepID=UPI00383123C4